jgi:hypothetical protein
VKLERYAANEIAEVVRAPDDIRVLCGRGAAHRDGPTMGVLTRGMGFAFFGGQNDGGVSIYEGSVDRESLKSKKKKKRVRGDAVSRRRQHDTLTRTRSADISYPYADAGPRRPVYPSGIPRRELPHRWSPMFAPWLLQSPLSTPQTNAQIADKCSTRSLTVSSSPLLATGIYQNLSPCRKKPSSRKTEGVSGSCWNRSLNFPRLYSLDLSTAALP